jgi:hypothetical protein
MGTQIEVTALALSNQFSFVNRIGRNGFGQYGHQNLYKGRDFSMARRLKFIM